MPVLKFFRNTLGKGEIARNEQFLLFSKSFLPFWRPFCHFDQDQNCHLQILLVWKSPRYVVSKIDEIKMREGENGG